MKHDGFGTQGNSNVVNRYDWVKSRDPSRPVHYEGDVDAVAADVFSYMYPSLELLIEKATSEGDDFKKPVILCEYAHAMGNGPGLVSITPHNFIS